MPAQVSQAFLAMAALGLTALASPSQAAITFDAASRAATTTTGRTSLSWTHTVGGGTNRMILVGVAVEDTTTADANITSVTCAGAALTAVPSSKISGGGTGIIQTQLFYGLNGSLGAAGAKTIVVNFQGPVDGISAGAVSFDGVNQAAPEAAATRVDTSGADSISTSITTRSANAWVVDVVGSGNSGSFTAGSGQTERWDIAASGMTGAMSTKPVASASATTMAQAHSGANRLAHSLVSIAQSGTGGGTGPFTLTTTVVGSGTITRNPNATSYASGTVVTLTATPASGFQFAGWSGDLSGTANPTTITMSANRSVTATFTQIGGQTFTLTTNVVGSGTITRNPNAAAYPAGTVVTLTATPAAGFQFTGWSGSVTGTANPTTVTMSANRSVTATFTQVTQSFTLTTSTAGCAGGSVSRSPNATSYPSGTVVTLTGIPGSGCRFNNWSGDASGTANPTSVTMSANRSVTANFVANTGLDFNHYGFATQNGGTTGGGNLTATNVNNLDQLRTLAGQEAAAVIRITGTITGNEAIRVLSNKTIVGAPGARLVGIGFTIGQSSRFGQVGNVIIRNIIFEKPLAPIDKIAVQYGAHNVWIDHNEFFSDLDHGVDFYDGQVDVTHGADFITVSWNVFHDHFKNSLVGNSENTGDEDIGHLRVTYHHNFFREVDGRNPSIRFGTGHVYNNYYLDIPDYGVASRIDAQVRVEANYFQNVMMPIRADTSLSDVAGFVNMVDTNRFVNCGPNSITRPPGNFTPSYMYRLDAVDNVPSIVQQGAGVGKVTF